MAIETSAFYRREPDNPIVLEIGDVCLDYEFADGHRATARWNGMRWQEVSGFPPAFPRQPDRNDIYIDSVADIWLSWDGEAWRTITQEVREILSKSLKEYEA